MTIITNDRGVALVWAVLLLVFTSIMSIAIFNYTQINVKETVAESNQLSAFYVAESGIELANTALHTDVEAVSSGAYGDRSKVKLINVLTSTDQPEIVLNDKKIIYDGKDIGKVDVSIKVVDEDGKTWIKIVSKGVFYAGSKEALQSSIMKIDIKNHANIEREFISGGQ